MNFVRHFVRHPKVPKGCLKPSGLPSNISMINFYLCFQVTLYTMMFADRRTDPLKGLLLYLKQPFMELMEVDQRQKSGT